jgi:hypothetical protein
MSTWKTKNCDSQSPWPSKAKRFKIRVNLTYISTTVVPVEYGFFFSFHLVHHHFRFYINVLFYFVSSSLFFLAKHTLNTNETSC